MHILSARNQRRKEDAAEVVDVENGREGAAGASYGKLYLDQVGFGTE